MIRAIFTAGQVELTEFIPYLLRDLALSRHINFIVDEGGTPPDGGGRQALYH
jgi:hypothetical protein